MARRWLLKTEPEEWSWEHQQANRGISNWDGVRNAQAQKNLRAMELGDLCFFYHSGSKAKEIVGITRVCKTFYPDPSDTSGKHGMVDIEAVSKLSEPLSLSCLKREDGLHNFIMFRQPRLSVIPVSTAEWNLICELAGQLETPLRLDVNGECMVDVNEQAPEWGNGEAKASDASRMCQTEQKNSSPHHNANVRGRFSNQIAQCDNKIRDVSPSRSSRIARRQPSKRKTLTDATKVKVSGSVSPSEASQPSPVQRLDAEMNLVAPNNSLKIKIYEISTAIEATEGDDDTCMPSNGIGTRAMKFVPDVKRVYSRRSRKQGDVGEPLPINAEVKNSRDTADSNSLSSKEGIGSKQGVAALQSFSLSGPRVFLENMRHFGMAIEPPWPLVFTCLHKGQSRLF